MALSAWSPGDFHPAISPWSKQSGIRRSGPSHCVLTLLKILHSFLKQKRKESARGNNQSRWNESAIPSQSHQIVVHVKDSSRYQVIHLWMEYLHRPCLHTDGYPRTASTWNETWFPCNKCKTEFRYNTPECNVTGETLSSGLQIISSTASYWLQ